MHAFYVNKTGNLPELSNRDLLQASPYESLFLGSELTFKSLQNDLVTVNASESGLICGA